MCYTKRSFLAPRGHGREGRTLDLRMEYRCTAADEGEEVLTLLRREMGVSTSLLRRLKVTEDGILLDGERVTVRRRVAPGQLLSIRREPDSGREKRVPAQAGPLDIVYEDEDLLLINKPAGLPVHPSPGHFDGDTVGNRVVFYLAQSQREPTFRAINRLDRGTSGLMTAAKNQLAAQRLEAALSRGELSRRYHAVVEGTGLPDSGTIDLPIGRREGWGIARCVREDGQRAVTHFRLLAENNGRSLLELALDTGRTHQIRVHLSHLGHPVCGDFMYGTEIPGMEGFALCSVRAEVPQPTTGERLCFSIPDPAAFAELMEGKR